jgi:exodeoxyribonuclease V gamma subunit
MLYLYQSNRLERLLDELCDIIARPLSRELAPEEIVVQNPGTARWLSRRLARRLGIAANLEFPLPARFVWTVFASQLEIPDTVRDFDRQTMLWRIFKLLGAPTRSPEFTPLEQYLQDDHDGRMRYQLAGRIADLFDQYMVYRPDMLAAWERGEEDHEWQAALWRQLTAGAKEHRAALLQKFRDICRRGSLDPARLPERVLVFGISSLAPAYLEVLQAISPLTDVHLFHLSPCRSYWLDLVSEKDMAKIRSRWRKQNIPDVSGYYETGNSLLTSLGSVGRDFSRQLLELDVLEKELYEAPGNNTLLACLQRDILDLPGHGEEEEAARAADRNDPSLQFHSCHSRLREIQVLHDRVLDMFARDPGLKPGDVLVMAPEIEAYDPAVRAVFGTAVQERHIPWSLADRTVRAEKPLAEAFLSLFELLAGRFTAPEILAFLETESVRRRFGIDEPGTAKIRRWIRESGIRWGMDAGHREQHGCDISDLHSWVFGLKRMLLGYLTGAEAEIFAGIAPYAELSADDALLLGRLSAFFTSLQAWSEKVRTVRSTDEWACLLHGILDDFFAPDSSEEDFETLRGLREIIEEWRRNSRDAEFAGRISLQVVTSHFAGILAARSDGQSFLSGRVTFCNMVPMRSLPFAVIWLLGMNDTDYPRSRRPDTFDRMRRNPAPGDRDRRSDDCYLFLEALISARRVFAVSWIGRDQQDNSIRSPSVVVATLLDQVEKMCRPAADRHFVPPVTEHPLQPFSRRCFAGDPATASYAAEWLPAVRRAPPPPFLAGPLPDPGEEYRHLEIRQLVRFWSNPVQAFLRERLGLDFAEREDALSEKEPFSTDALERYFFAGEITDDLLRGADAGVRYLRLRAEGRLPHGSIGRKVFDEVREAAEHFVLALAPHIGEPLEDIEIDLDIGPFHLSGWLDGLGTRGLVRYRAAALKCRDLLRLWIEHLAYNLAAPGQYPLQSWHIATDRIIRLLPVREPRRELENLLELYRRGMREPLRFYPRTSQASYLARTKGRPFVPSRTWDSAFRRKGEGDDPAYRLVFGENDPFAPPFAEHAEAVFEPLYRCLEESDASV